MSSDLFVFDGSFYHHSSPEMVSSDGGCGGDLFFSENFSSFCDSPFDVLQELTNNHQSGENPVHEYSSVGNFSTAFLSSSPPSHQLENLSLCQTTHLQTLANDSNLANCSSLGNGYGNFSGLHALEVKTEECQVGLDSSYNYHYQSFLPQSYGGPENATKMMQRSYSSNSFDGKPGFLFQPRFDTLLESPNYQTQALGSPENSFLAGQLRRVCSTGDLQSMRTTSTTQRSFSSPLAATESSPFAEDANFKVGRYSAEERKERISKYRAKRNQRNFSKTIKYACRKTLADNRPRIRGRFARNDEVGELPKARCSTTATRDEDEDELWFDGLHEEEDEGNSFVQAHQFQYHGY